MLLPQSSNPGRLPVRIAFVTTLLALVAALPLNATPQLISAPTYVRFGRLPLGQTETQLVVLTNTKSTSVIVSAISAPGPEFRISSPKLPVTLKVGASIALNITFAPTALGVVRQQVTITSNASDPNVLLTLAGRGVANEPVTAKPASLAFGEVAVGSKKKLAVVLTNNSKYKQALDGFSMVGSEFVLDNPPPPPILNPGQSITLDVTFAPQVAGMSGGSLLALGPVLNVPMSGDGVQIGQLSITPRSLNFGDVMVGATDTQTGSLKATGGIVTVSSAASSASQFVLAGTSFPLTIDAGQTVDFKVKFTPQKDGSASGTLSFSSDATNGVVKESLAGTGTAPQVNLTWSASTSQVAGYNVYRRLTGSGSYKKINSSLDPDTSFTDATVVPGKTYEYVTTAVNSKGKESAYSSPAEVEIP